MKFKPILFSTPMVQAIREGRKIQTRRIIFKDAPCLNAPDIICTGFTDGKKIAHFQGKNSLTSAAGENPKYQTGNILWVRETWSLFGWEPEEGRISIKYKDGEICHFYPDVDGIGEWIDRKTDKLLAKGYLEEDPDDEERLQFVDDKVLWEPSIFMPKWASRIFLKVTNERVQRLQDISEEDAKAEGIQFHFEEMFQEFRYRDYDKKLQSGYGDPAVDYPTWRDPISSFKSLWQSINGKESWDANPWVWVYDFKRVEKPENFG